MPCWPGKWARLFRPQADAGILVGSYFAGMLHTPTTTAKPTATPPCSWLGCWWASSSGAAPPTSAPNPRRPKATSCRQLREQHVRTLHLCDLREAPGLPGVHHPVPPPHQTPRPLASPSSPWLLSSAAGSEHPRWFYAFLAYLT